MTTPADIARALSEAQRDALCGKFSFASIVDQEIGEAGLYEMGLWKRGRIRRGESIRTHLGDNVRQLIQRHRPTANDASTDRNQATVGGCGKGIE